MENEQRIIEFKKVLSEYRKQCFLASQRDYDADDWNYRLEMLELEMLNQIRMINK